MTVRSPDGGEREREEDCESRRHEIDNEECWCSMVWYGRREEVLVVVVVVVRVVVVRVVVVELIDPGRESEDKVQLMMHRHVVEDLAVAGRFSVVRRRGLCQYGRR